MDIGFHHLEEKRLLTLSFYIAGAFVIIALGFAILTSSGAILFDAAYSLIAFVMSMLTLKVANLVQRPDDDRFHFGYTAIEPTLNMFKSLIIIATCVYAVASSVQSLLAGGHTVRFSKSGFSHLDDRRRAKCIHLVRFYFGLRVRVDGI